MIGDATLRKGTCADKRLPDSDEHSRHPDAERDNEAKPELGPMERDGAQ
jgi:hypothetical protein